MGLIVLALTQANQANVSCTNSYHIFSYFLNLYHQCLFLLVITSVLDIHAGTIFNLIYIMSFFS